MKRTLLAAILLLVPLAAFAQAVDKLVDALKDPVKAPDAVFKIAARGDKASGQLLKILSDTDAGVRYHALWALDLIGDKTAGPAVVKLLRDADSLVRLKAVFASAKLAPGEVMPLLERLASDPDSLVRASAATVLADRKEKHVTDALLKSLELHKSRFSAMALVKHGKQAAPGLRELLESKDAAVKRMACFALGQIGDKDSLDLLALAAKDNNPDVAVSASVALALMHHDKAYSLLSEALKKRGQSAEEIPAILKKVITALAAIKDEKVGRDAKVYAQLGKYGLLPPVPELAESLCRAGKSETRAAAARALGEIGSDLALGALLWASGDKNEKVRLSVAIALGRIAVKEAAAPLRQLSYDSDPGVRAAAANALAQLDIKDLSPIFKRMSEDENEDVREAAVRALDIYPPSFTEPILISLYKKEKNPDVRALLIKFLGRIATENALHIIMKAADSKEMVEKGEAILALGNFKDPIAVQKLISVLKNYAVIDDKVAAVKGLGKTGSKLAVPVLTELLAKGGDELSPVVAEALGDIGSKDAVPVLLSVLAKAGTDTTVAILTALGKLEATKALSRIIDIIRDGKKPVRVRRGAVLALGGFAGQENAKIAALGFLKKDKLAAEAAATLSRLGDDSGLAALGRLLHKPDSDDRLRAVQALRHFHSKEATALLFVAAKDSDAGVAITAALELLSRSKFEALAILQVLLAKEEPRKKLHEILKELEISQVLDPVMEKLANAKDLKMKMVIVGLLGHTGIKDFRVPADASLADYHRLASRWLRWWRAATAKMRSGPGGIRGGEGETEKTREGALRGLEWLKKKK